MSRRINRVFIDEWINQNGPNGLLKLAMRTGVSSSTIEKARIGHVPKRQRTRNLICRVLKVSEEELFPLLAQGRETAS